MQRGIPFETKLPTRKPVAIGEMNATKLNAELEKGYADVVAGRLHNLEDVVADMQRDYGI